MSTFGRKGEARIKRANTDWWINEKAIVGMNGMTYIAYVTDMGEIHVKEMDAKCSLTPSRDVCICRMNCNYSDEHNAPSLCILENGKIMVAYTGHGATHTMKYRITRKPYDISTFGPERVLLYEKSITYAQLFENTRRHELWLFARVDGVTWEFRYSSDEGENWSKPAVFLASDAGGLFYFDIHKMTVPCKGELREQWIFALYGHPRISKDHTIRSGIFDGDGFLLTMDGERTGMNLYGQESGARTGMLDLEKLAVVYASPEGTTVRLLAVSATLPYRVGLAAFTLNRSETAVYYSASWKQGSWRLSEPIAPVGEFLAPGQMDGSQTYVGGMAYYYGVGEAGLHPSDERGTSGTNRIYLARADEAAWYLESYVTHDLGKTYEPERTIRKIPKTEQELKLWRPVVPLYAQDNLPVYWHEGTYTAHTGGWHCDVVMDIEFDL